MLSNSVIFSPIKKDLKKKKSYVFPQVLASAPGKAETGLEENPPHHDGDDLKLDAAHHHDR